MDKLKKVDSEHLLKGETLFSLTKKNLSLYFNDLRKWWDELSDDWKEDLIGYIRYGKTKDINYIPSDFELLDLVNSLLGIALFYQHENFLPLRKFSKIHGIEQIGRSGRQLKSLEGLEDIVTLEDIRLRNTKIWDLSPLKKLKKLYRLVIYKSPIKNLDALSDLKKLEILNIAYSYMLENIDGISGLENLSVLGCSNIGIGGLFRIDYSPIKHLQKLEYINCGGNILENMELFRGLKNLETLVLNRCVFFDPDLTVLSEMRNLKKLKLSHTNIQNILPLTELSGLEKLWIENTNISKWQILYLSKALPKLKIIIKIVQEPNYGYEDECIYYEKGILKKDWLQI